jgi:chromosome segregation ATPase
MEGMFKTAMSGFKKSDVLEFIEKQEKEYKQREKELTEKFQGQIDALKGELDSQKIEREDLRSRIGGLEEELMLEGRSGAETQEKLRAFADEVTSLRGELGRSENRCEELKREIAIHKQNIEAKNSELSEKDARVEQLSDTINTITTTQQRISRVMVEAQNTADKIIENAKKEALSVIGEAEKKLKTMQGCVGDFRGEVDTLGGRLEAFAGGLEGISHELADYTGAVDSSGAVINLPVVADGLPEEKSAAEALPKDEEAEQADFTQDDTKPQNSSLFNFSLQNRMFNWDKE